VWRRVAVIALSVATLAALPSARGAAWAADGDKPAGLPHLERRPDGSSRLVVDGKPFLILGGELGNSSGGDLPGLGPVWARLGAMHLNTVLVPVSWEQIEPDEGKFDFRFLRGVLDEARRHQLRVVLLWFGSWKNGMSSYVPGWVKTNVARFPRAHDKSGAPVEALSAFGEESRAADTRAFVALMKEVRRLDEQRHTVLMVQVENEVAIIGDAADRGSEAMRALAGAVPAELIQTVKKLDPSTPLGRAWKTNGARAAGTWQEVFGKDDAAREVFAAWSLARYTGAVAAAGKAVYPLPMFVNAALYRPGAKPGEYPSGGPLPHLTAVWRLAAPAVDVLAPDIYLPNFGEWCDRFARDGSPLFVPEMKNGPDAAANLLYAFGAYGALGTSPFAIDTIEAASGTAVGDAYRLVAELTPALLAASATPGARGGVLLDSATQRRDVAVGKYVLHFAHDRTWEWSPDAKAPGIWPHASAIVVATGPDELVIAGTAVIVTFDVPKGAPPARVGLLSVEAGHFAGGRWIAGRALNGDETHQGRHVRLPPGAFTAQRVRLYRY
jgi:beta-galactosidase GanA